MYTNGRIGQRNIIINPGTEGDHESLNTSGQQHVICRRGKESDIRVYYTNCRILRNETDLLRRKACSENFDIITITAS